MSYCDCRSFLVGELDVLSNQNYYSYCATVRGTTAETIAASAIVHSATQRFYFANFSYCSKLSGIHSSCARKASMVPKILSVITP